MPAKSLAAIIVAVLAVAACSGAASSTGPTQGGAAGSPPAAVVVASAAGAGASPTTAQATAAKATPAEGGGSTGGGVNSIHFEVTSQLLNKSGELVFVPLGSVFGGADNTSLSFSNASTTDVFGVLMIQGIVAVSYGTPEYTVAGGGGSCVGTNLHFDGSSASGSFDCKDVDVLMTAGGIGKGEIKGTFDGHK